MIKGTDEEPNEVIHMVRSGKVSSTGTYVSIELGCLPPSVLVFIYLGNSLNPILLEFMETSLYRHDQLIIPTPLLSEEL